MDMKSESPDVDAKPAPIVGADFAGEHVLTPPEYRFCAGFVNF